MSTADVLTIIVERIYEALDKNGEIRAVALDIQVISQVEKLWCPRTNSWTNSVFVIKLWNEYYPERPLF